MSIHLFINFILFVGIVLAFVSAVVRAVFQMPTPKMRVRRQLRSARR